MLFVISHLVATRRHRYTPVSKHKFRKFFVVQKIIQFLNFLILVSGNTFKTKALQNKKYID